MASIKRMHVMGRNPSSRSNRTGYLAAQYAWDLPAANGEGRRPQKMGIIPVHCLRSQQYYHLFRHLHAAAELPGACRPMVDMAR
jgi:hypothetical protein